MSRPDAPKRFVARTVGTLAAALLAAATFVALPAGEAGAADVFLCTPTGVGVFSGDMGQRIHVRCSTPYPSTTITYFAYPTKTVRRKAGSDVEYVPNVNADRFLEVATAALVNSRPLYIWFDLADTSGTKIGCGSGDCRLLKSVEMR